MWKGAVNAVFEHFQIPEDGCDKVDGRFDEEVASFLYPLFVQREHDCSAGFRRVRDVEHRLGHEKVAAVGPREIVEIYHIEFRRHWVLVAVFQGGVVGDQREVGEFEVV